MSEEKLFCKGGGCTAKLGSAALDKILKMLPRREDPDLLVGYDHADDGAVYRLTDELAIVQTLDFFPPMVEDPYLFGQIAAANAMSDIWAMGGQVKTALNIVCFPENGDLNQLGRILQGGADKVHEAGGVLCGGHSLADEGVKYGLSVTGIVHPDKVLENVGARPGDRLILTKPLGVGIVCTAQRMGAASQAAMELAVTSMSTLNKYACDIARRYPVHGCTDVTGFGLLVHLSEMLGREHGATISWGAVPRIRQAERYAEEFYITAAGQRNRNRVGARVAFDGVPFSAEELLFDPQTSGGLLLAVEPSEADCLLIELKGLGLPCGIIGEVNHSGKIHVRA